jgi:hypothetical protein
VFEKGVLRRDFGCKMEEGTGGWGKLHNEELHNLFSFHAVVRMINRGGARLEYVT